MEHCRPPSAGSTIAHAQAEVDAIASQLRRLDPLVDKDFTLHVLRMHADVTPDARRTLLVLLGAVMTVLLIGCANVANLTLARSIARQREFAIRTAIGAGRACLVRQLFAESLLLNSVSGAVGLLLALWATPALARLGRPTFADWVKAASIRSSLASRRFCRLGPPSCSGWPPPGRCHKSIRLMP